MAGTRPLQVCWPVRCAHVCLKARTSRASRQTLIPGSGSFSGTSISSLNEASSQVLRIHGLVSFESRFLAGFWLPFELEVAKNRLMVISEGFLVLHNSPDIFAFCSL